MIAQLWTLLSGNGTPVCGHYLPPGQGWGVHNTCFQVEGAPVECSEVGALLQPYLVLFMTSSHSLLHLEPISSSEMNWLISQRAPFHLKSVFFGVKWEGNPLCKERWWFLLLKRQQTHHVYPPGPPPLPAIHLGGWALSWVLNSLQINCLITKAHVKDSHSTPVMSKCWDISRCGE